jgi:hypothetical protein
MRLTQTFPDVFDSQTFSDVVDSQRFFGAVDSQTFSDSLKFIWMRLTLKPVLM